MLLPSEKASECHTHPAAAATPPSAPIRHRATHKEWHHPARSLRLTPPPPPIFLLWLCLMAHSIFNPTKTVLVQFWKSQAVKIPFEIKLKDGRQIFRGVPGYKMIQKYLKMTVYFWNNQHFNNKCQGKLIFSIAIW